MVRDTEVDRSFANGSRDHSKWFLAKICLFCSCKREEIFQIPNFFFFKWFDSNNSLKILLCNYGVNLIISLELSAIIGNNVILTKVFSPDTEVRPEIVFVQSLA